MCTFDVGGVTVGSHDSGKKAGAQEGGSLGAQDATRAPQAESQGKGEPARETGKSRLAVYVLLALSFALGCTEFTIIGIEPDIASSLGVELSGVGNLVGYFAIAYAVCTPLLAVFTGRFRRYRLMLVYLVIFNIGNLCTMFAPVYGVLAVGRILTAAVSGALLATSLTFVPELVPGRRVASVVSLIYTGFSIASVLGVPAGKLICGAFGWNITFGVAAGLAFLVSVALVVCMPRTGATDEPSTPADQLVLVTDGRVIAGMLIFVFGAGGTYAFYTYVTPVLQDVMGLSSQAASTMLVVYGLACVASNLLSGWVAQRFGVVGLVGSCLIQAVLLALLFFTTGSLVPGLINVALIGVGMYVVNSPGQMHFLNIAQRDYPKALTMAASVQPMSFNIGIAVGSFVGGTVVAGPGLVYIGFAGAVLSVVGAVCAWLAAHLKGRARK